MTSIETPETAVEAPVDAQSASYGAALAAVEQLLAVAPTKPDELRVAVPADAPGAPLVTLLFGRRTDAVHAFAAAMGVQAQVRKSVANEADVFTEVVGALDEVRYWAYALVLGPAAGAGEPR